MRDFPGGLVAKAPCSQCSGVGLIPGQETMSQLFVRAPQTAILLFWV